MESSSRAGGVLKIGMSQSLFRDYFKQTIRSTYSDDLHDTSTLIQLPNMEKAIESTSNKKSIPKTTYYRHISDLSLNFFSASFYSIDKTKVSLTNKLTMIFLQILIQLMIFMTSYQDSTLNLLILLQISCSQCKNVAI